MLTSENSAFEAPQSLFGPHSAGPTVQRLVLGGHLRRLREEASITTEQAASAIRGSHSKISRMEHGRVGFKERDIADLLTLYGVTGGEERAALLKLAREANTPGCCKPKVTPARSSGWATRRPKTTSCGARRRGCPGRRSSAGRPRHGCGRSWTRGRCGVPSAARPSCASRSGISSTCATIQP